MNKLISYSKQNKSFIFVLIIFVMFWYLAMFPGRLGYDYALAIRMIQDGKTTDWWTALFFWFLKITSFSGKSIFLPSLIGIFSLAFSVFYLISTFPTTVTIRKHAVLAILMTPIFGVFGVTVSHDVFQTVGIIMLVGIEIRFLQHREINNKSLFGASFFAFFCLLSVKTGPIIILFGLVSLIIHKKLKLILLLTPLLIGISLISSIGISTEFMKNTKYYPVIADLKCIAQHPEARITLSEWNYLLQIAPKNYWIEPLTCATSESASKIVNFNSPKLNFNYEFFKNYAGIVEKNPAIFIMAHLQRSRGALPPPFFQGPENQVNLDINKPLGQGTNIALQSGPELLHPSIDEPSVDISIGMFKPFEILAQIPTLIINQASWFWGWGGFWLLPIIYFWIKNFTNSRILRIILSLYPIFLLHTTLIILTPGSLGRYYMSTILIGIIVSIVMFLQFLKNVQSSIELK